VTNDEPAGAGSGGLSAVNGLIDAAAHGGRELAPPGTHHDIPGLFAHRAFAMRVTGSSAALGL
jgi:hypothetical protein